MEPADARSWWMSAKIPNDQFMLYAFAEVPAGAEAVASRLRERAATVADLGLRVMPVPADLDRPYWVSQQISGSQVVVHPGDLSWQGMLDVLGELMGDQLDATREAWRIHVFSPVQSPGGDALTVVVLLIIHALGDGRRTAAIARELFAGNGLRPEVGWRPATDDHDHAGIRPAATAVLGALRLPVAMAQTVGYGLVAYRHARDAPVDAVPGSALCALNRPPGHRRTLRTLQVPRDVLRSPDRSVTIAVLEAISVALPAYLGDTSRDYSVEVTLSRAGAASESTRAPQAVLRNNFGNVGIDLRLDLNNISSRGAAMAAQIKAARERDQHPTRIADRRAQDVAPALLTHWGVRSFDPDRAPDTVTGNTVVSSVNRGAADFDLLGAPVRFTAGFPALSPAQGLTHGVHGLGDTVTISLTSSPEICPDLDRYTELLGAALGSADT